MVLDAFISYRRSNGYLMAYVVHDRLKERGINCFLDVEDIKAGRFDKTIESAILAASNFILILSPNALDRCVDEEDWMRKEILLAQKERKNIILVMFDGFQWPDTWPENMPEEIKLIKLHHGVTGTQEYLHAMIDKIYSYIVNKPSLLPKQQLRLAVSDLVVIDSIMQGWNCQTVFNDYNCTVEELPYKWSDKILNDLSNGRIDLAIYNRESCEKYNLTAERPITIVQDMCSSMGGRNFYILAKKSEWHDYTVEDFKKTLNNETIIAVAKSSDQFRNLLYVLDMTEEELKERGVKIMDYHSRQGLDIFETFPKLLLISGQNIRFLAQSSGDYFEIISYDDLPQEKKIHFKNSSMNALLVGPTGLEKLSGIDLNHLASRLLSNFYQSFLSPSLRTSLKNNLSHKLEDICESDSEIDYIIDNILFETYRILK